MHGRNLVEKTRRYPEVFKELNSAEEKNLRTCVLLNKAKGLMHLDIRYI